MSEDMAEAAVADPEPMTLSARLDQLASERPAGGQLRGPLEEAADAASALEADLARARREVEAAKLTAEVHRVERVKLEQRVVDAEDKVEALEARVFEVDSWRTAAEEELEGAKLEAATLAGEVQRLEAETAPFGQRRSAWEAAAGERTAADTLEAVLTAAQWIAEGLAVVELGGTVLPGDDEDGPTLEDVSAWLTGRDLLVVCGGSQLRLMPTDLDVREGQLRLSGISEHDEYDRPTGVVFAELDKAKGLTR